VTIILLSTQYSILSTQYLNTIYSILNKKMKIYSWNVNGIRAIQNKGFMDWFTKCKGDIICLQETKAHAEQLGDEVKNIGKYKSYWFSAEKKGYSSVATYCLQPPIDVKARIFNIQFLIMKAE
jgi:exonuclease III